MVQVYNCRSKSFTTIPFKKLAGLKTQAIQDLLSKEFQISDCNPDSLSLTIRTKTGCSFLLPKEIVPFRLCKELIIVPMSGDDMTEEQNYHLHLSKPKDKSKLLVFQFNLPVVDSTGKFMYTASLSMKTGAYKVQTILRFLRKVHSCDSSVFTVYNEMGEALDDTMKAIDFVKKLLHGRMYVSFAPTAQQMKTITWRVATIKEILSTEEHYVETLSGFRENVGGVMMQGKFLSKDDINEILAASDIILNIHTQMLGEMKKWKIDFMTQIGDFFCEYVPFLKVYHQYVVAYKRLLPAIVKAMNSQTHAALFHEFAEGEYANGLAFDSVLIIPVQRGPRYSLLLRETLKHTPKAHPDYQPVSEALDKTQEVLHQIEQEVSMVDKRQKMMKLESMFEQKISLIQPQRVLVGTYKVQARTKFMFIIFSDEFWVASINNVDKLTVAAKYSYIDINCIKYAKQSVVIRGDTDKVFSFWDLEERDAFFTDFRETSKRYQNEMRDQIRLDWELKPLSKSVELVDHGMVYCCGYLWLFGGRDSRNLPKGDLRKVKPGDKMVYIKEHDPETDPAPRYSAALCASEKSIYVFGGTDGTTTFDDFWRFDCAANKWIKIEGKGAKPVAGSGLDLSFFGDRLVLTGGNDCFRAYQYLIDKNEWILPQQEGVIIPSLTGHCVVPVSPTKGSAVIIGGRRGDGTENNLLLVFHKYGQIIVPVRCGSLSPCDRVGHKCCLIGDNLYVYGGEEETAPFALSITAHTWEIPNNSGLRKVPQLAGHAMAVADGKIFIHGGMTSNGDIESSMYQVTPREPPSNVDLGFMMESLSFEKDDFVWNMLRNPTSVRDELSSGDITVQMLIKTRNIMAMTNMKLKK